MSSPVNPICWLDWQNLPMHKTSTRLLHTVKRAGYQVANNGYHRCLHMQHPLSTYNQPTVRRAKSRLIQQPQTCQLHLLHPQVLTKLTRHQQPSTSQRTYINTMVAMRSCPCHYTILLPPYPHTTMTLHHAPTKESHHHTITRGKYHYLIFCKHGAERDII